MAQKPSETTCPAHAEMQRKLEEILATIKKFQMILYILLGLSLGMGGKAVSELVQIAAPVVAAPAPSATSAPPAE
jgi:hypothetical protein